MQMAHPALHFGCRAYKLHTHPDSLTRNKLAPLTYHSLNSRLATCRFPPTTRRLYPISYFLSFLLLARALSPITF